MLKKLLKMSFSGQELLNEGSQGTSRRIIPPQLEEVVNLTTSINRLLEDCSIQWKSTISKKQWETVNFERTSYNLSWQKSVVARTFFENKDLDEAFHTLLTSKTMFNEHLTYFMGLLKGEVPTIPELHTENQEAISINVNEPAFATEINPPDVSIIEDRVNVNNNSKSQETLADIQHTFSDLMKAKMYFDKMFVSLNTIVRGAGFSTINSSNCICQICSNVLETASDKTLLNLESGPRRSKRIVKNVKRLTKKRVKRVKTAKLSNKKDFSAGDQNQSEIM